MYWRRVLLAPSPIYSSPEGDLKIPVPGLKSMSVVIESSMIPDHTIEFVNTPP